MQASCRKALFAAALTSCLATASNAAEPLKIGFMFLDPVGASGWTYQHDISRLKMEKTLGREVSVRTVPDTHEGPDSERVARELSADGTKLVFGASFGYMHPIIKVAADYPGTAYMVASGYLTTKNVGGYNAKWQEGGYLAGIVAGKTTKSNVLGFVGAMPVPDVMWYLNAFTLGARSVNPQVIVRTVFVNAWGDSPKERDAAKVLMNQGADVLTHFTDTPAVTTAAEERGVGVISFHSDMTRYAPKNYLTGVTHDWSGFYTKTAREVLAGTWKPSLFMGSLSDSTIKMAPLGPRVSKETADLMRAKEADIISGKLKVFAGPIKDQKGTTRVPAGTEMSMADIGKMDWLVDGVVGNSN